MARMHDDEVDIDDDLARHLVDSQFPRWRDEALVRQDAWGTDHVLYRLGDDKSVRLPRIAWAQGQARREARWLPVMAPHLPVAVPVPLAVGAPTDRYPHGWCVSPWLPGRTPVPPADDALARELAAFVRALQSIPTDGGPAIADGRRGGRLAAADESVRRSAARLTADDLDGFEPGAVLAVWHAGLDAEPFAGPPVWCHGDLQDGNVLVAGGRLTGVIDWGSLGVGDPAVELLPAWNTFAGSARARYLDDLGFVDDAMVARAKACAMHAAIHALPYYRHTNPDIVARSRRVVVEVLRDSSP